MAKLLKLRRGTTSQHSSFTGAEGEVTVDTDKEALVVHNGSTAGGFPVARADGTGVANFTITGELDAATLDISGNADIDGTLEADAYTVNGTALDTHIAGVTVTNATNAVTATNANHVSVADNESTNENNKIVFIEDASATGNVGLESDGDFHYNPSTGLLTTPAISTSGNITIAGNLTVNGTTTTVATTNTTVTDNLLELNSGASSNANDSGILIERGSTGDNAIIAWDESADKFTVGTTTATNDATGNISITTGTIVANVEGNLTGTASSATNADTVDNLHAASFARSDTEDTITGKFEFTTSGSYPLKLNGSDDGKIKLYGSSNPKIQFQEGTTDKAFIQWHSGGYIRLQNQEDSSILKIQDDIVFSSDDGSNFHKVWHAGNDGASSGLDADSVDGMHAAEFLAVSGDEATGDITFSGGAGAVTVSAASDIRIAGGSWSGEYTGGIKIQPDSSNSYFQYQGNLKFRAVDASNAFDLTQTGNATFLGSVSDSKGNLRSIPLSNKTGAHVLAAADAGKVVYISTGGVTFNNSIMSEGDAVTIINNSGSDQTITQGSGCTLYNTTDASTGNRTLAGRGMCTIWFKTAAIGYISGAGLS